MSHAPLAGASPAGGRAATLAGGNQERKADARGQQDDTEDDARQEGRAFVVFLESGFGRGAHAATIRARSVLAIGAVARTRARWDMLHTRRVFRLFPEPHRTRP